MVNEKAGDSLLLIQLLSHMHTGEIGIKKVSFTFQMPT